MLRRFSQLQKADTLGYVFQKAQNPKGLKIFQHQKPQQDIVQDMTPLLTQQLYNWQFYSRDNRPTWVTHSCPPTSSEPTLFCNMVAKDIINRFQVTKGNRVHFVHGFSGYGVNVEPLINPLLDFREQARDIVKSVTLDQAKTVQKWGVMTDFRQSYITSQPSYEANVLERFADLQGLGRLNYCQRPVMHQIQEQRIVSDAMVKSVEQETEAMFMKASISDFGKCQKLQRNYPTAEFVLWSEESWLQLGARGVSYNPNLLYCLVKHKQGYLVIAQKALERFEDRFGKAKLLMNLVSEEMEGMVAVNPVSGALMRLVPIKTLAPDVGSGLHTVTPAHSLADLRIAQAFRIPTSGVIDSQTGLITLPQAEGMTPNGQQLQDYLLNHPSTIGFQAVMSKRLATVDTNKPVTLLTVGGWSFEIKDSLKFKCFQEIQQVKFHPELNIKTTEQTHKDFEKAKRGEQVPAYYVNVFEELADFDTWFISEQGHWGTPIPYFYHTKTQEVLASPEISRHVASVIRQQGADAWWRLSAFDLLPPRHRDESDQYTKGDQVFDIQFDQSLSWDFISREEQAAPEVQVEGLQVIKETSLQRHVNKTKVQKKLTLLPSSLVLESFEQHTKWLMLSLVTSVALRGKAPYTRVKTQGFVDIPNFEELLGSEGVDTMRAWVAANESDSNQQMAPASLSQTKQEVQLIRSVLLSLLNRIQPSTETNPTLIDTVLLKRLRTYCHEIECAYDKLEIQQAYDISLAYIQFIATFYLPYSQTRIQEQQSVIKQLLTTLLQTISPILVYTAQEVWQLSPPYDNKPLTVFQLKWDSKLPQFSEDESIINQILDICVEVQETKGHVVITTERPKLVYEVIEHIEVLLDRHVKVNAKVGQSKWRKSLNGFEVIVA